VDASHIASALAASIVPSASAVIRPVAMALRTALSCTRHLFQVLVIRPMAMALRTADFKTPRCAADLRRNIPLLTETSSIQLLRSCSLLVSAAVCTHRKATETAMKTATKPLPTHEEFCLTNAANFVAARGRTPATRTREQFATLPEAQAFGAAIGDGRTMIYAVTTLGHSAHITNA